MAVSPPADAGLGDLHVHPVLAHSLSASRQGRAADRDAEPLNPLRLRVIVHGNKDGRAREHKVQPPRRGWFVPGSSFQGVVRQQLKRLRTELDQTVFAAVLDTPSEFGLESDSEDDLEANPGASVPQGLCVELPYVVGTRRGRYRIRHPCDAVPVLLEYLAMVPALPPWDLEQQFERYVQRVGAPVDPTVRELPEHPRRPPRLPGLSAQQLEPLVVAYLRALVDLLPAWVEGVLLAARKLLRIRFKRARKFCAKRRKQEQKLAQQHQSQLQPRRPTPDPRSRQLAAYAYDMESEEDLELAGLALDRLKRDAGRLRQHFEFRLMEMQRWAYSSARRLLWALDRNKDGRVSRKEFLTGWADAVTQLLLQELQLDALFPMHCHRGDAGGQSRFQMSQETSAELSPMMLYLPLVDSRSQEYRRHPPG